MNKQILAHYITNVYGAHEYNLTVHPQMLSNTFCKSFNLFFKDNIQFEAKRQELEKSEIETIIHMLSSPDTKTQTLASSLIKNAHPNFIYIFYKFSLFKQISTYDPIITFFEQLEIMEYGLLNFTDIFFSLKDIRLILNKKMQKYFLPHSLEIDKIIDKMKLQ